MNVLRRKNICILLLICFSFVLYGCSGNDVNNSNKGGNVTALKVNNGAVVVNKSGEYKTLDLVDEGYKPVDSNDIILEYNTESGNYLFMRDGKHYVHYDGKEFEIKDSNYSDLKISPNGQYLAYMVNDKDGYRIKVISLEDDKEVELNISVAISGELFDWINGDTLVYYGIGEDKTNGIFTYDLKNKKEDLLYRLDGGYVEYLVAGNNNVIIFQQTLDNNKVLKIINRENRNMRIISDKIDTVNDILKKDDKYYLIGSFIGDIESLYEIEDSGDYKRLVYDFPKVVDNTKEMTIDGNGDILFIGYNSLGKDKDIYKYSKDGSINLISTESGDYTFVKRN